MHLDVGVSRQRRLADYRHGFPSLGYLAFHVIWRNRGLKNNRHTLGYEMSNVLVCADRRVREWVMLAARVHFAQMDLTKLSSKLAEYPIRFCHGRVALSGVPNVKTEGRVGEFVKDRRKFGRTPAGGLSFIHVLDAQKGTQFPPKGEVAKRIWVNNNRPTTPSLLPQAVPCLCLPRRLELAWSVDGDVFETRHVERIQAVKQRE